MPVQNTILNYYNNIEDSHALARSEVFYYLKFINYDKDLFKDTSKLTSKPTVVFYTEDAVNKVILDYSLANETDKKYLYSFFANTTQLNTITLSDGDYLDASELSANLSGTFVFTEFKDNKLFATVSSVTNQNSALDVYFGDYFTGTPQLTKSGSLGYSGLTENYALISVNPKASVSITSMGILPGDLIEIISPSSANNQIKYEVLEISTINEKEVIRLKPYNNSAIPTEESLIGSAAILNVYIKGIQVYEEADVKGDLGCCYSADGTTKYENQTKHQCSLRNSTNIFSAGTCTETQSNIVVANVQSEKTYYVSIISEPGFTQRIAVSESGVGVLNNTGELVINRNTTYNFIQEDVSNTDVLLRVYETYPSKLYTGLVYSGLTQNILNSVTTLKVTDTNTTALFVASITNPSVRLLKLIVKD